jgi:hypothetical protein
VFSPFYVALSRNPPTRDDIWAGFRALQQSVAGRRSFEGNTLILPVASFCAIIIFFLPW